MSFAELMMTLKGLEGVQELINAAEMSDRNLRKYYEERGEEYGHVQQRIDLYMIQRGQIAEVIDIIDGLKVNV